MKVYGLEIIENKENANLLKELQEFVSHLQVKSVTNFKSHDGMPLNQADLYYKGKKVCFVSDDDWGGEMRFDDYGIIDWARSDDDNRGERPTDFQVDFNNKYSELEFEFENGKLRLRMESIMCELFQAHDLKKDMKKGVLVKSAYGWEVIGYKITIPTMLKKYTKNAVAKAFQPIYDEQIKKGKEILNTNYLHTTIGLAI